MYLKIDTEVKRFQLVFKGFDNVRATVHISDHLEANSKFCPSESETVSVIVGSGSR